ncbi:hypothetical protein Aeqsu_1301 [Aequorivita sublithincola DSM 14238]|uniref:Secretion system C-terminal sorting domain-containing protein n=1 Tax=Aequorivita sublithincola (strain DSM 14238 / LMG 21431 / ACAM 643 / 9-3) TaxID=746697 RepID=I3YUX6_AEQSU|nr:T9SS type A sorting domain-containing protein [Aequorivita sublithincola]AFL80794.1 hypothetical protein Aeqsu_1301 [Aequorivita sublithincola DSM 14238]
MKKLLLLFTICFSILASFAQPAGILNETFRLKSLSIGNSYYTPNGESPNLTFYEVTGNYVAEANGISNVLNAAASFSGNSFTLNNYGITLNDCVEPNCYYEDLYFYSILTTTNLDSKTFTYNYYENNGYKYFRISDSNNKRAYYSTEPAPEPNPLLFQTWYLFMQEVDLGDPIFFDGSNPPQITINPDFTYTGVEGCATISGDFILGNGDYSDFLLQSRNYQQDESNCPPGSVNYAMNELQIGIALNSIVYEGANNIDYFEYESFPGFISRFSNAKPLATPENSLIDLKIFPNPAQNKLIIHSANNDFDSISIIDINGRQILSKENFNSNEIDVSSLKTGMYFITIETSEGNITKKFIKN